jgi:hypothetical protein
LALKRPYTVGTNDAARQEESIPSLAADGGRVHHEAAAAETQDVSRSELPSVILTCSKTSGRWERVMHTTIAVVFILLGPPGLSASVGDQGTQTPFASRSLPDNPCDLLTAAGLADVTGLEVTSIHRVASIHKVVSAQLQGREPEPGMICSFETNSHFGAISIAVPPRSERRSELYWEARSKYFETFPGSAQHIEGLGIDAWLAGGAGLRVLVRENEYLMLSTQRYQRQSRELLVDIARAILRRQSAAAQPG